MSKPQHVHRMTAPELTRRKGATPIVCLTAYTAPVAKVLDAHTDLLLVGDSVGMVIYGMKSTIGVTVDMMIAHGAAVMRATRRACVVIDLPFGSFETSPQTAFETAARVVAATGCSAVKIEGGIVMADTVRFLTERGIPVMGHVGLKPQSVHAIGGYPVLGRGEAEAEGIRADARAIADAGAFAIVLENIVEPLARQVTADLAVPTIGIGASADCDGQILVTDDMAGMFTTFTPKFVKRYAELAKTLDAAAEAYAEEVRARQFPGPEHCAPGDA